MGLVTRKESDKLMSAIEEGFSLPQPICLTGKASRAHSIFFSVGCPVSA